MSLPAIRRSIVVKQSIPESIPRAESDTLMAALAAAAALAEVGRVSDGRVALLAAMERVRVDSCSEPGFVSAWREELLERYRRTLEGFEAQYGRGASPVQHPDEGSKPGVRGSDCASPG